MPCRVLTWRPSAAQGDGNPGGGAEWGPRAEALRGQRGEASRPVNHLCASYQYYLAHFRTVHNLFLDFRENSQNGSLSSS